MIKNLARRWWMNRTAFLVVQALLIATPAAHATDCPSPTAESGFLQADNAYVRDAASLSGEVLRTLAAGTGVRVIERGAECATIAGQTGRWVRVRVLDDEPVKEGWVFEPLISYEDRTPVAGAEAPRKTLEVAVLHIEGSRLFALPVLSFPGADPSPVTGAINENAFDRRNEPGIELRAVVDRCAAQKTPSACTVPADRVARHHGMRMIPKVWFDATRARYTSLGGGYFGGEIGYGIGFDLGDVAKSADQPNLFGRVLLSDPAGHSATRVLAVADGKRWPELAQALAAWRERTLAACQQSEPCRARIRELAAPERVAGAGHEFALADGRKLQYLSATSTSEGKGVLGEPPPWAKDEPIPPDMIQIDLWRLVNADGSARLLPIANMHGWEDGLNGVTLVSHFCETQCGARWSKRPDVFVANGRVFLFGPFSLGTTSGHMFFEVLPTKIVFLGWYRWGT